MKTSKLLKFFFFPIISFTLITVVNTGCEEGTQNNCSLKDTVSCYDTVSINDTLNVFDTISVVDTLDVFDTIPVLDTINCSFCNFVYHDNDISCIELCNCYLADSIKMSHCINNDQLLDKHWLLVTIIDNEHCDTEILPRNEFKDNFDFSLKFINSDSIIVYAAVNTLKGSIVNDDNTMFLSHSDRTLAYDRKYYELENSYFGSFEIDQAFKYLIFNNTLVLYTKSLTTKLVYVPLKD